ATHNRRSTRKKELLTVIDQGANDGNDGIRREFSVGRTPQQNGVTERRNRTLIEAARTMIVEETLNIIFLENTPNVTGNGPDWLFDVDSLTISMNYVPVVVGNQTNGIAGTRDNIVTGHAEKKTEPEQEYILIPICTTNPLISQDPKVNEEDAEEKTTEMDESGASDKDRKINQANKNLIERMWGAEADLNNMETTININKQRRTNHKDYQNCLFACFLSQIEPKKVIQALEDLSWIEAMANRIFYNFNFKGKGYFVPDGCKELPSLYGTIDEKVYVDDIIFGSTKKSLCMKFEASTPMEPNKAMIKDEEAVNVDAHLYRSMIGSLMDLPFNLEAFSDSDYPRAILDRKSTTGEYVAAANMLWIGGYDLTSKCLALDYLLSGVLSVRRQKISTARRLVGNEFKKMYNKESQKSNKTKARNEKEQSQKSSK
ncbi:putative ribonuclease H-like domain-containing protein, partial [Tanacetum coccineum]